MGKAVLSRMTAMPLITSSPSSAGGMMQAKAITGSSGILGVNFGANSDMFELPSDRLAWIAATGQQLMITLRQRRRTGTHAMKEVTIARQAAQWCEHVSDNCREIQVSAFT